VRRVAPVVAVGAAGIVAAGIAAAFSASRRAHVVERREADKQVTGDTAREVMSVTQVVIYRQVSVSLEILDRRDDLAGKRF